MVDNVKYCHKIKPRLKQIDCPKGSIKVQDPKPLKGWKCEQNLKDIFFEKPDKYDRGVILSCEGGQMSADGQTITCPDGRVFKLDSSVNQSLRHLRKKNPQPSYPEQNQRKSSSMPIP